MAKVTLTPQQWSLLLVLHPSWSFSFQLNHRRAWLSFVYYLWLSPYCHWHILADKLTAIRLSSMLPISPRQVKISRRGTLETQLSILKFSHHPNSKDQIPHFFLWLLSSTATITISTNNGHRWSYRHCRSHSNCNCHHQNMKLYQIRHKIKHVAVDLSLTLKTIIEGGRTRQKRKEPRPKKTKSCNEWGDNETWHRWN